MNFVLSLGVFCCCVPAMFIYVCVVCLTIGEVMCFVVIIALAMSAVMKLLF